MKIDPVDILFKLRGRDVDTVHNEPISGSPHWLKPCIHNGKRIGITDCCEYDYECDHHKKFRKIFENQSKELN